MNHLCVIHCKFNSCHLFDRTQITFHMTVSDDMFKSFVALPQALLRQQFDQSIRNLEKSDGIQHIPIKLIEKHTTPKFTESWEIRKITSNNICGLFGRWRNKKNNGKTKTKKGNLSRLLGGGRVQARFPEHCLCWFSMGMPFFYFLKGGCFF